MVTATVRRAADGKILGYQGIIRDITERNQTEEALRETNALNSALFDHNPIQTIAVDGEGRIIRMNLARRQSGDRLPRIGDRMYIDYAGKHETDMRGELMRCMRDGKVREFPELKYGDRFLSVKTAPFPGGAIITRQDITQRKRLEEQLRQAVKMESVGQLAGGVAHDFNNILTGVMGYVHLSLPQLEEESPIRENLFRINALADRAADLVRRLLAFSRRQPLHMAVFSLNELVQGVSGMLRRLIREDIDIEVIAAADQSRVRADRGQIEDVLMNLVVNANDAMPEGGKLTIRTANIMLDEAHADGLVGAPPGQRPLRAGGMPGPYVMVAVSDTGRGMDKPTQDRIFEPFFTTKEVGEGTGLGLAVAHGTVTQHNGYIRVHSEPGKGATFEVHLPQAEAETQEPEASDAGKDILVGSGTILLVEDEESVRTIVRGVLEEAGYAVVAAGSPHEAEALFAEQQDRADLLLTDVVMPGMDGRKLYERLAAQRPGLKVLYMSGYADATRGAASPLGGAASSLPKPFTPVDLLNEVRKALSG